MCTAVCLVLCRGAQSQLAALVSKCKGAEDLEYFLLESASLVGLHTPPDAGAKVRAVCWLWDHIIYGAFVLVACLCWACAVQAVLTWSMQV